ncbi:MAG: hypothetical protein AAGF12_37865, partial [Myxococcota bacterium]
CGVGGTCHDGRCDDELLEIVGIGSQVTGRTASGQVVRFSTFQGARTARRLAIVDAVELSRFRGRDCARRRGGQVSCLRGSELIDFEGVSNATDIGPSFRGGTNEAQLCVVHDGGRVDCWPNIGEEPQPVEGLPPVEDVEVGGFSCARTAAGELYCWDAGWDYAAACSEEGITEVTQVTGIGDVQDFSISRGNICGVDSTGRVRCAGANTDAQTGARRQSECEPFAEVAGIDGVESLDVDTTLFNFGGNRFSSGGVCVVRNGGELWCWGRLPTNDVEEIPIQIDGVSNAFQYLGTGSIDMLLRRDGTVQQLNGSGRVISLRGAVDVSTGDGHACSRRMNGSVSCWGVNQEGQLGDGQNGQENAPVALSGGLPPVDQLAVGGRHSCALVAGSVYCWGENDHGQLGDGTGMFVNSNIPVPVPGIEGASVLLAGKAHTCARVSSPVRWLCWGDNRRGQVSSGVSAPAVDAPVPSSLVASSYFALGGDTTCTSGFISGASQTICEGELTTTVSGRLFSLSVGGPMACGRTSQGAACFGSGFLGDGPRRSSTELVEVENLTSILDVQVAEEHACALLNDGQVLCWGENDRGQLGDPSVMVAETPIPVPMLSSTTSVSVSDTFTCARVEAGRVFCWGSGVLGQLGTGTGMDSRSPVEVVNLR